MRITPHPINNVLSYSLEYISKMFNDKFNKFMIFQETNPIHLHIYLETKTQVSSLRKWIKKYLPKLKGNAYWQVHPCTNCKQKDHKKDMFKSCAPQARTYVAKEGQLLAQQGFSNHDLCKYVAIGKELATTAALTSNNSRRLKYIGNLYINDKKNLHAHILRWYETQNQVPPRGNIMRRLIHTILFQYDASYRSYYGDSLKDLCKTFYSETFF